MWACRNVHKDVVKLLLQHSDPNIDMNATTEVGVTAFIICVENMIQTKNFLKIFHKRKLYLNDFICVKIITNFIRCKNTTTTS